MLATFGHPHAGLVAAGWHGEGSLIDGVLEVHEIVERRSSALNVTLEMHWCITVSVEVESGVLSITCRALPEVHLLVVVLGATRACEQLGVVEKASKAALGALIRDGALLALAEEVGGVRGVRGEELECLSVAAEHDVVLALHVVGVVNNDEAL